MDTSVVIRLPDRFDFSTHRWFTDQYEGAAFASKSVVLDFSQVDYMDSSALGMLVLLYRRVLEQTGRGPKVARVSDYCHEILEMANLYQLFQMERSVSKSPRDRRSFLPAR